MQFLLSWPALGTGPVHPRSRSGQLLACPPMRRKCSCQLLSALFSRLAHRQRYGAAVSTSNPPSIRAISSKTCLTASVSSTISILFALPAEHFIVIPHSGYIPVFIRAVDYLSAPNKVNLRLTISSGTPKYSANSLVPLLFNF